MEINLEREYQCTIWKELEKTPGVYYENKAFDKRKTEVFFHYSCFESIEDHKRKEVIQ